MFTGLWLRICFCFGSQQQTVTITTPGIPDIQFASTPPLDAQHQYVLFLSISRRGSSFCSYFPECGQFRSIVASCSNLGTGQGFLAMRGNVQRRCSLVHTHTRASTRRAVARGRPNFTVRCFPSSRPLTHGQNTLQKCPSQTTAIYHPSSHLPHITRHHYSILDPLTLTPQYNHLPRSRRLAPVVNGYSTTRNVRGGRGLCVYVSSEILPLALTPSPALTNATSV